MVFCGMIILLVSLLLVSHNDNFVWTNSQKIELCKAYIGSMFGRPIKIINYYSRDDKGRVYVRYKRPSDGIVWSYSCDFNESSMIWSGFLNDTGKWGRWRQEDRVQLRFSSTHENIVFFDSPDSGKVIAVSL